MRLLPTSVFLIFLLFSSATITHFSAFAQTTPRPYYTVLETPTHSPPTLYENTPVEFTTKVTNQGTAAKSRDVFVKMSHTNEAGEHNYTCDSISGAYSQSVNLNPGESIDLHWKCEIFNVGTYTLTILDKSFTYTVIQGGNEIEVKDIEVLPNPPKVGDKAVFVVTVVNYGLSTATKEIKFSLTFKENPPKQSVFGNKMITLDPGKMMQFSVEGPIISSADWDFQADSKHLYGNQNDSDGDGLDDSYEQSIGTDPNNPDTDKDDLSDGYEVKTSGTDPKEIDTDGDLLSDGLEVLVTGTNPKVKDTDKDGVNDGEEYEKGTNPTAPQQSDSSQSSQIPLGASVIESEVYGKANLVVTDVSIMPRKGLQAGDTVTITVVVKNTGDAKGSKNISGDATIDSGPTHPEEGRTESRVSSLNLPQQSVTVEPGKEKTLQWKQILPVGGTYDLYVEDVNMQFTVKPKIMDAFEDNKSLFKPQPRLDGPKISSDFKDFDPSSSRKMQNRDDNIPFSLPMHDIWDQTRISIPRLFTPPGSDVFKGDSVSDYELPDITLVNAVSEEQVRDDLNKVFMKLEDVANFDTLSANDDSSKNQKSDFDRLADLGKKQMEIDELKEKQEKNRDRILQLEEKLKEIKETKYHEEDDKIREKYSDLDAASNILGSGMTSFDINSMNNEISALQNENSELDNEIHEREDVLEKEFEKLQEENMAELNKISNIEDKNQKSSLLDDLDKSIVDYKKSKAALDASEVLDELTLRAGIRYDIMSTLQSNDKHDPQNNFESNSSLMISGRQFYETIPTDIRLRSFSANDATDFEKIRPAILEKFEKHSTQSIEQINYDLKSKILIDKLQDSLYYGNINEQNVEKTATISLDGISQSNGEQNVIFWDIPIKTIHDDGKMEKFSVLGGNLAIVNPSTNQVDYLSVAFGKGKTDQSSGKSTFLINAVDKFGERQTITLHSGPNGEDSKVLISGGKEFGLNNMLISNALPLSAASEKTIQNVLVKQVADDFAQYLVANTDTDIPSISEWRKLYDEAKKADEQRKKALKDWEAARKAFEESQDPKLRDEVKNLEKRLEEAKQESSRLHEEKQKAFEEAREKKSKFDKLLEEEAYEERQKSKVTKWGTWNPDSEEARKADLEWNKEYYKIDSAPEEIKTKYNESDRKWSESRDNERKLEKELTDKKHEATRSGDEELQKEEDAAFKKWRDAEKTSRELDQKAKNAWEKLDKAAKSKGAN